MCDAAGCKATEVCLWPRDQSLRQFAAGGIFIEDIHTAFSADTRQNRFTRGPKKSTAELLEPSFALS